MIEFRILYSWLPWMRGKRYIYLTICQRRYFLSQFLRQRCMSTHCFQSLYQLGPGSLWCIPKPPAKNFNLAALGIMRVVTLNSSQCVQSEFQLHPQLVPLCHILQFILNLPQCQTSRGSCYGEVSLWYIVWYMVCVNCKCVCWYCSTAASAQSDSPTETA